MDALARFRITKAQIASLIIAVLALLGVGYTSLTESKSTISQSQLLSDAESPAANIIFTQRETLVYATRLAQWSNGGTTRRQVQIARNLLAQRLAVIDTSGESMGSRAAASYWNALHKADEIVDAAPMGVLPEHLHSSLNAEISPVIDEILFEARNLVVSYQRSIDSEVADNARQTAAADRQILVFFYIFIIFSAIFLLSNVRTNFKRYRRARRVIESEQRRLEETIEQLRDTESTVVKLQDLDQSKNAFISTVNHELRTPLTSIIGYIDVIREEQKRGNTEIGTYLDVLDRNAQILLNLVESMLTLSKIDSAQGSAIDEKVSIIDVIDDAIFVMRPVIQKAEIEVNHLTAANRSLFVRGDSGQLNQVFLNLIGNAIKFSPAHSTIEISAQLADKSGREMIQIAVRDSGIGIPEREIGELFQRFYRASNAVSNQYQGTGLGLAIVEQTLALHGATIEVESEVGKGTTFLIAIPAYPSDEIEIIEARKVGVLERSIERLKAVDASTIKDVTHEIGGAIGFYGFERDGQELLTLSRSLDSDAPVNFGAALLDLQPIITSLAKQLENLRGDVSE